MVFFAAFVRKIFEKKVGEFCKVPEGNCQMSSSEVKLLNAEIKEDVFDELHLPVTLRGGYIDEISLHFAGMFGTDGARVVIKDIFLVFGPHSTDFSWDHVYKCKSRLIDLFMKIYEIKPRKKKKADKTMLGDFQKRMISEMKKSFLKTLQVAVSNIHFRYEDGLTQTVPLACGFKIGYIGIAAREEEDEGRKTTGDWKHSKEKHAKPEFCQAVRVRRLSAYWDLGQAKLFAHQPTPGPVVRRNFTMLNLRETFSACVVEKVLQCFPQDHPRRKYLEGPVFRERLDYHQYIVFPLTIRAEITGNEANDETRAQKAPMMDLDVAIDPVEVALDSEQIKSVNHLLAHMRDFTRQDVLLRTRPREPISKYLPDVPFAQLRSDQKGDHGKPSASKKAPPPAAAKPRSPTPQNEALKALVRGWWRHAFKGVVYLCKIPRSPLDQTELLDRSNQRETYIRYCMELEEAQEKDGNPSEVLQATIKNVQMNLATKDILEWRMMARDRRNTSLGRPINPPPDAEEDEPQKEASEKESVDAGQPNTLQAQMRIASFNAYFLGVADGFWSSVKVQPPKEGAETDICTLATQSPRKMQRMTRQLIVKCNVADIRVEAAQRGRNGHRVARWVELGIGSISTVNCNVQGPDHVARNILTIMPIETPTGTSPVCLFVGACTLQCLDRNMEPGDVPFGSVLQPWEGLAGHLKEVPMQETPEQTKRLGFLNEYKDILGKLMMTVFARVGQVRALDYAPFRRRLLHFITRGQIHHTTDFVRRPSSSAMIRELLVKLQRKVEGLTGKSDVLGVIEGVVDGVRGRQVDHYNSQYVLCKEASLSPITWKALRNGKPQAFHLQFHQLQQRPAKQRQGFQLPTLGSTLMGSAPGDSWSLLPWKVAMLLLPKADFAMSLECAYEPPPKRRPEVLSPTAQPEGDVHVEALSGAEFQKWGRNGKCKKRWVYYDESLEAIVWKNAASDALDKALGAIPLSEIQDVCVGICTPVLKHVRSNKLVMERILSIVANDRTLDLQAPTIEQKQAWVTALKAVYRQYSQAHDVDNEEGIELPKEIDRRNKIYQDKWRSDRCVLKSTYKKLRAVSMGKKEVKEVTRAPSPL